VISLNKRGVMIDRNSIVKMRKNFLNTMQKISPEISLPLPN